MKKKKIRIISKALLFSFLKKKKNQPIVEHFQRVDDRHQRQPIMGGLSNGDAPYRGGVVEGEQGGGELVVQNTGALKMTINSFINSFLKSIKLIIWKKKLHHN